MSKKKAGTKPVETTNNLNGNLISDYAQKASLTVEPMYLVSVGRMTNVPKIKKIIGNVIKYYSFGDAETEKLTEEEYFKGYKSQNTTLEDYKTMAGKWMDHCIESTHAVRDNDKEEITIDKSVEEYYDITGFEYGDKAIITKPAWRMPLGNGIFTVLSKGKLSKVETEDNKSEVKTEKEVKTDPVKKATKTRVTMESILDEEPVETKEKVESSESKKDDKKKKKGPMYTLGYDEGGNIQVTKNYEEEETMANKKKKKKNHVLKTKADIQEKKHKKHKKDKKKKKKLDLEELIENAVEVKPRQGLISRLITWWRERKVRRMMKDAERAAYGDCRPTLFERIKIWFAEKFGVFKIKKTAVANG